MNDEQQLWKDVQKLMNQFPGFVAIAKKIGEIGSLEEWAVSKQQHLDALTQEVEKQHQVIASERAAADRELAQKRTELEVLKAGEATHNAKLQGVAADWDAKNKANIDAANKEAARIIAAAQAAADDVVTKKKVLEQELAAVQSKVTTLRDQHAAATDALAKVKEDHAAFVKKISGG